MKKILLICLSLFFYIHFIYAASSDVPPFYAKEKWKHWFKTPLIVTSLGSPQHLAADKIANPGSFIIVEGKFAYGKLASKDLEDEEVSLWIKDPADPSRKICLAYGMTDSDGRIELTINRQQFPDHGIYEYRLIVGGDHTFSQGALWIVQNGQEIVITDVDGTLTTSDGELFRELLLSKKPEMFAGANEVMQYHANQGRIILYLTGRGYFLKNLTRDWLVNMKFPRGPLETARYFSDQVPDINHVGTFKRDFILKLLKDADLKVVAAYGNAVTDIYAYAKAKIDPNSTFIIGPNAGKACEGYLATQPIMDYREHLQQISR